MNVLDIKDICIVPWVEYFLGHNFLLTCCWDGRASSLFDSYNGGPWTGSLMLDNPSFLYQRKEMIEKKRASCPDSCPIKRQNDSIRDQLSRLAIDEKSLEKTSEVAKNIAECFSGNYHPISPMVFNLSPTMSCNQNCSFCFYDREDMDSGKCKSKPSVEQLHNLFPLFKDVIHFSTSGGDTFGMSDEEIDAIYTPMKSRKGLCTVTTNGRGLTLERYEKFFVNGVLTGANISLSSLRENVYRLLCRRPIQPVLKNITDISSKYTNHSLKSIAFVVTSINIEDMESIAKFAYDNGIKSVIFNPVNPVKLDKRGVMNFGLNEQTIDLELYDKFQDEKARLLEFASNKKISIFGIENVNNTFEKFKPSKSVSGISFINEGKLLKYYKGDIGIDELKSSSSKDDIYEVVDGEVRLVNLIEYRQRFSPLPTKNVNLPSGLISPEHQLVIQIEITNACQNKCSNCTRFCGHHKTPFFMTFDQFKRAVDSLSEYKGLVGIMGGEPTLHPMFEEFSEYFEKNRPECSTWKDQYSFVGNFESFQASRDKSFGLKRGLWTSLGEGYKRHYETIQRVYRYQCMNDHKGGGKHMTLLYPRKELGISDEEWKSYRDFCWVQRTWSASITPKGAFFCEVAAALSHLFNECDGIPVTPDWWKKKPEEFGNQLSLCEYCSACLPMPSAVDSLGTDLVSPNMYSRLKDMGSKKPMEVINLSWDKLKEKGDSVSCIAPYLATSDGKRVHSQSDIEVGEIVGIIVCRGYDDYLNLTLPSVVRELKNVIVVTTEWDHATQEVAKKNGAAVFISDKINKEFKKGQAINDVLLSLSKNSWVNLLDADIILPFGYGDMIRSSVLNPGALYYAERRGASFCNSMMSNKIANLAISNTDWAAVWETIGDEAFVQRMPWGYCQVFNLGSSVLKDKKSLYPVYSDTAEFDDSTFAFNWYGENRHVMLPKPLATLLHLSHGESRTNWSGRKSERLDNDLWWLNRSDLIWRIGYRCGDHFTGLLSLAEGLNLPEEAIIVEIGSMLGDGALVWSAVYPKNRIISVDIWLHDKCYDIAKYRTRSRKNIELWKMSSLEAKERCLSDKIVPYVVYLDGDHAEDGLTVDINAWKNMIHPNGILCGHDYCDDFPSVIITVDKLLGKPIKLYEDGSWISSFRNIA